LAHKNDRCFTQLQSAHALRCLRLGTDASSARFGLVRASARHVVNKRGNAMVQNDTKTRSNLTRRGFLSASAALSVLSLSQWPARAMAANIDVDAFMALSRDLLGRDGLSPDFGAQMLQGFISTDRQDALSAMAAGTRDDDLGNEIVASWYTGVSPDPKDLQVVTYTDAQIWTALDYTKPMGYCGGGMGYWADPPTA
jgi:hypothetical protein